MGITCIICLIVASIAISSLMSSEFIVEKEIGLLKVLGANTFQFISSLLVKFNRSFICCFIWIYFWHSIFSNHQP